MALRKSLSTFLQSSLRTTVCNSRIVNKNFNGGFPNTNSSSELPPPRPSSLEIPKTAKIPFITKRSLCDVSWERSNTDLLPPPTPRPISREEVEAALKLLNDVSSVLNDFPWTAGVNVLPVNSSDGSLDAEGVRLLLNSSDGSLDEERVIDILVVVAWRSRCDIGTIVEIADYALRRSKYEMGRNRMKGLIAEVPCYGFEWMCTLFGWKFSCELKKGGKSGVIDRRWETFASCLEDCGLRELGALEKDFSYLANIKCAEDGVRYCLGCSDAWAKYLEDLETFKARLKGVVAAVQDLDREKKFEDKLFHIYYLSEEA